MVARFTGQAGVECVPDILGPVLKIPQRRSVLTKCTADCAVFYPSTRRRTPFPTCLHRAIGSERGFRRHTRSCDLCVHAALVVFVDEVHRALLGSATPVREI